MRQVCGLDVHKDSVFACILNENGVVFQEKYGVLTPELEQLAAKLQEYDVSEVCMESTSIYWMPVWCVLEPYVAELKLVNPYFIKQLPGKKSDVKDAEWIATCLLKDLIRGSYVPADIIQQLRQYDRRISDLNAECVRKLGKLDAALQRCNIRISNYVSTTDGKSYKEVVRLISEGVRDPAELTKVIHGRTINRVGRDIIQASLTGVISNTDIDVIRQLREEVDLAQRHKDECQSKMDAICQQYCPEQLKNLQSIPGIKGRSATAIIAEVGSDVSSFQDAAHLVSWCGLKPRNEESAGKTESVMQWARETGRDVVHVDLSASKSMWYGESEKIVKGIFTRYRNQCKRSKLKPILLFNEADGLFSKRKDISRGSSVDQTENTIQNILLEEMEKLDGILVATTNLADNLDSAFERRFLFKIKLEKPSVEAKRRIWSSKLPTLTGEESSILAESFDFSGGEIDNIVRKAVMEEVLSSKAPDIESVMRLCREEKMGGERLRRIGF